jgi:hypothetical protein
MFAGSLRSDKAKGGDQRTADSGQRTSVVHVGGDLPCQLACGLAGLFLISHRVTRVNGQRQIPNARILLKRGGMQVERKRSLRYWQSSAQDKSDEMLRWAPNPTVPYWLFYCTPYRVWTCISGLGCKGCLAWFATGQKST